MNVNKKSLFYLLPFIVMVLLLFISWQTARTPSIPSSSPPQGKSLPIINLPLLLQPNKRFTSNTMQGKVCLLNVWASWCPACQAEHPVLMAIKEHYAIAIYGINFKDDPTDAEHWLKKAGNPYKAIGVDIDGAIATDFAIDGIPDTFLLDKHGMIRYRFNGSLDLDTWNSTLMPLIKQLENEP